MGTSRHFGIVVLSEQTGVKIETIRYYEREELPPSPLRTLGAQCSYSEDHLKRLTFIRRSRELGFTIADIRGLLALLDRKSYTCGEVKALTLEHAASVRSKISDLQRMEKMLVEIASGCEGGTVPGYPIIDALLDLNTAAVNSEEHSSMKN